MVKYVITGATGNLGSQVLKHLLKLVPATEIAIVIRDSSKISSEISSSDVQICQDAEKLLIVSVPSIEHEYRVKHHVSAIDAAKRTNVKHVYYTSLMFGTDVQGHLVDSVAHVMQAHLDTEAYLAKSGLTYTVLREGDGSIAWVAIEDLGEATAKLMVKGGYEQKTLLLTGTTSISLSRLTKIFAEILHRPIHFRIISVDEYVGRNKRPGTTFPHPVGEEDFLRKWATTYKALENGESACVDPLVQQLLGKELISIQETLNKMFKSKSTLK